MSDPSSTTSPRSSPISAEDADAQAFDGAQDILRAWGAGLRPDPDLTVSEWADRHRKLSSRASAEPGQYRTVRTPYMKSVFSSTVASGRPFRNRPRSMASSRPG